MKTLRLSEIVEHSQTHASYEPAGVNCFSPPHVWSRLAPAKPTRLYDVYWEFAAKRQDLFFCRVFGCDAERARDPILTKYKFTNAYRASDRVSQYLIQQVIYNGDQSPEEVFFRTLLFKLFNKIETWELLTNELGGISYASYSFRHVDRALVRARNKRRRIYSGAYIMPSGATSFGSNIKHRNHLRLLELLMRENIPEQIASAKSLKSAFELLKSFPMLGDFLSYQYVIDLNYSILLDFSENDFVVPGPGALSGIHKCFSDLGGLSETELIKFVADHQEEEFQSRGIRFKTLWGRRLQLIDCQNLFCELDKYSRALFPILRGANGRTRIKQLYTTNPCKIQYWYPPKWGLDTSTEPEVI